MSPEIRKDLINNLPSSQRPNGCGPASLPVPDLVFKSSCDTHDLAYAGVIDQNLTRKDIDEKFLKNMLNDIKNSGENFIKKKFLVIAAYAYYAACRTFGWMHCDTSAPLAQTHDSHANSQWTYKPA